MKFKATKYLLKYEVSVAPTANARSRPGLGITKYAEKLHRIKKRNRLKLQVSGD